MNLPGSVSFWNSRYEEEGLAYGADPNGYFREILEGLTPGRILLPGEGEGRNALFAAKLGWQVDAFDYSVAAQKKALAWFRSEGVSVQYALSTFDAYPVSPERYDAIGLFFIHLPREERARFHANLCAAMKPGAILILEAFHTGQLAFGSGGPKSIELLYTEDIVRNDFRELKTLDVSTHTTVLTEGKYHQGKAQVVRYLGVKIQDTESDHLVTSS